MNHKQVRNSTQPAFTCSKLTIEIPEQGVSIKLAIKISEQPHWRRSTVFIVNFEHVYAYWAIFQNVRFQIKCAIIFA